MQVTVFRPTFVWQIYAKFSKVLHFSLVLYGRIRTLATTVVTCHQFV